MLIDRLLYRWSAIAKHLHGRTDNEIKNFWNTHLKKKLIQMGFDPMTHRPRTDFFAALPQLLALVKLRELVDQQPWTDHSARLQAEAAQAAKLQYLQQLLQSATVSTAAATSTSDLDQPVSLLGSPHMASFPSSLMPSPTTTTTTTLFQNMSQIPDIQIPCSFDFDDQEPMGNEGHCGSDNYSEPYGQGENSTPRTVLLSQSSLPPLTDISISNPGDACSTSSCGGSSTPPISWPDQLLLDDFMAEFSN